MSEVTSSSSEPLVSAELADALQDTDTLGILAVLDSAITKGDAKVVRYCAQVLRVRLAGEEA